MELYLFCAVKIRASKVILIVKGRASNNSGPFNGLGVMYLPLYKHTIMERTLEFKS